MIKCGGNASLSAELLTLNLTYQLPASAAKIISGFEILLKIGFIEKNEN